MSIEEDIDAATDDILYSKELQDDQDATSSNADIIGALKEALQRAREGVFIGVAIVFVKAKNGSGYYIAGQDGWRPTELLGETMMMVNELSNQNRIREEDD